MNITKRDQILLLGMVIILAAFAFFRFAYLPTREEIKSLSAAQQELQQQKERMETVVKKTLVAQNNLEQQYANLNKRLPTEDELVPLLTILDDSCHKCQVPLTAMEYSVTKPKKTSDAQILVFTITTQGKVTLLFDLLNELETSQRLISVQDVSLTAVKAEQQSIIAEENEPPAYYIAPPGIPEAKLQRVKFEVEAAEEAAADAEIPVAASFVSDRFDMKITINAYYTENFASEQVPKEGEEVKDSTSKNAKGEV